MALFQNSSFWNSLIYKKLYNGFFASVKKNIGKNHAESCCFANTDQRPLRGTFHTQGGGGVPMRAVQIVDFARLEPVQNSRF
jgi:hypothetical protein